MSLGFFLSDFYSSLVVKAECLEDWVDVPAAVWVCDGAAPIFISLMIGGTTDSEALQQLHDSEWPLCMSCL